MSLHMEPGSGHQCDGANEEEKKSESRIGYDHENRPRQQEIVVEEPPVTNIERSSLDAGPNASSIKKNEVDELEKTKAEIGGVIEENQRLKKCLDKILNEYQTLQLQIHNIAERETKNSCDKVNKKIQQINEESELVSLSLGRLPSNPKPKVLSKPLKEELEHKEGLLALALGLDCKFETSKSGSSSEHLTYLSPVNSSEAKEEAGETWPPSKVDKRIRVTGEDEVVSQQNPAKKARVCVRARCDTPTFNDGCQWRKYGQKISKGNPCPRAYYRCTVAASCPVKKQVQRCVEDMSILITTYEGTHNHPLPPSATAMASTTSAAASVLLSGSSTSHSRTTPSPATVAATTTTNASLHGMNFYLSEGSKSNLFYPFPPPLSSSHPTITLDLTSNPSSSPFRSNYYSSSTSLNFSSPQSNAMSWSNNRFLSSHSQPYNNKNINHSTINLGRQAIENNIYYSYMQKNNNNNIPIRSQYSLPDHTIAAATKAITADPTFQSALAAALTSVIGTPQVTRCASSFLNNKSAASASPNDNRDNAN